MYPINSLLSANSQVQNMIINCSTMLPKTITMLKARPSPGILLLLDRIKTKNQSGKKGPRG